MFWYNIVDVKSLGRVGIILIIRFIFYDKEVGLDLFFLFLFVFGRVRDGVIWIIVRDRFKLK